MHLLKKLLFLGVLANHSSHSSVIIKGNKTVSLEKIELIIEELFDINEIQEALYSTDLFETVFIENKNGSYVITVVEKPLVSSIKFIVDGDTKEKNDLGFVYDELISVTGLKPGMVIDGQKLVDAKQKIRNYYDIKNYANIQIKHKFIEEGETTQLHFLIERGDKYTIEDVEFIGLKQFDKNQLSKLITQRMKSYIIFATSAPEPHALKQDIEFLEQFGRDEGFLNFKVTNAYIETKNKNGKESKAIYIVIDEGEKFQFGAVNTKILDDIGSIETIPPLTGDANEYRIYEYKNEIFRKYKEMGEAVAVTTTRTQEENKLHLDFTIKRISNRYVVSKILVKGNAVTHTDVILKAAGLTAGSYFDQTKVREMESRIRRLGFFKFVNIHYYPNENDQAYTIVINVEDLPSGELGLKGSWGLDGERSEFSLSLFYQHPNFLGTGNSFLFSIDAGQYAESFSLGFRSRTLFNRDVGWFVNVYSNKDSGFSRSSSNTIINKVIDEKYRIPEKEQEAFIEKLSKEEQKTIKNMKDASDSVSYTTKTLGLATGLSFDLLQYGSLGTSVIIEDVKTLHEMFADNNNISRFFKKDLFPNERVTTNFSISHGIGKAYHSKQKINLNNTIGITVDGTTGFVKYTPKLSFSYPFNKSENVYLRSSISYGYMYIISDKYYWIDHFSGGEVYMKGFTGIGPVERNRYTPLGGTQKFGAYAELVMPFIFPTDKITSFVGIYCGSVWGTNIENGKVMPQYAQHRGFKYDTSDIGGDEFTLRASGSVGIRVNLGPVKLEWAFSHIFNKNKETDRTKEFQFKLSV